MTTLTPGDPHEAGLDLQRIQLIRDRAREWIETGRHQNLVILIARRGVICLHEAWGKLTPSQNSPPVQKDSIFWIASNSKPVTATAIMMLVEDGLLGVNREVVEYIPELSGDGAEDITVRQLLTHTSGFESDADWDFMDERVAAGFDLPDLPDDQHEASHVHLHAGYPMKPWKKPGTVMSYSNYNYSLLGEIVRRVSGESFWDFTRQRIFEPLGMHDTSFRYPERFEGRMARLDPEHSPMEKWELNDAAERIAWDFPDGGGGLLTTARDYATFVQMILNGGSYGGARLLNPRTVREMTRNQIPGIGTDFFGQWHSEASWGLGFRIVGDDRWPWFDGATPARGSFMHGGAGGTEWWADPEEQLFGIYFSICLDTDYVRMETKMNFDLLQDLVTASIVD